MPYSISQVAEMYKLSVHTLRYYEKEGLLPSVGRAPSGIRKFEESDLEWLRLVECLKKANMPLKDIRQFLKWCQEGDRTLVKRRDMFHERRKAVLEQMAELGRVLEVIEFKCKYYENAVAAGTDKALRNKASRELGEMGEAKRTVGSPKAKKPRAGK